jgi:hypothetical protein
MSRAPRPKAFCTFCETARTITKSGKPMGHTKRGDFGCPGVLHTAKMCPTCNNERTVRQWAAGHVCDTCKGTGRIVR